METNIKINLEYPINVNGVNISELIIRRPKVKDRLIAEKINGNQADKEIRFVAMLCGLAPENIEDLDMADYTRIQEVIASFLS